MKQLEQIEAEDGQEERSEQRFRAMVEQVQAVIFEWDAKADTMYASPAFEREFGCKMPEKSFRRAILGEDILHEGDKQRLRDLLVVLQGGASFEELELRIRGRRGEYRWCKVKVSAVYGAHGELLRVVGALSDIDAYKRENALLAARAQRDFLTGLFNQATFRTVADEFLKNAGKNGRHALFVLDMDNFKSTNERLGHARADELLCEVAKGLREKFREDDILGRLSGDEFAILLKNPSSRSIIETKAKLIQELLRTLQIEGHGRTSGSVGIAMYPEDGATLTVLFENAEKALNTAKRSEKKRILFYSEVH